MKSDLDLLSDMFVDVAKADAPKSGPGSRGGVIIGTYPNGKPIYQRKGPAAAAASVGATRSSGKSIPSASHQAYSSGADLTDAAPSGAGSTKQSRPVPSSMADVYTGGGSNSDPYSHGRATYHAKFPDFTVKDHNEASEIHAQNARKAPAGSQAARTSAAAAQYHEGAADDMRHREAEALRDDDSKRSR